MAEEHVYTEKELKEMADQLLEEDDARNGAARPKRKSSKKKEVEEPNPKTPEERLTELLERARKRASSPPRSWSALRS